MSTRTDPKQAKLHDRALNKGKQIARGRNTTYWKTGKDIVEIRHTRGPSGAFHETKISTRLMNALPKAVKAFKGMGAAAPVGAAVKAVGTRRGTVKRTGGKPRSGQLDVNVPAKKRRR